MSAAIRTLVLLCLAISFPSRIPAQAWSVGDGLILHGDLVTLNETLEVIAGERLVVVGEKIVAVLRPGEPLPGSVGGSRAITLETDGWIFPGLIDSVPELDEVPRVGPASLERLRSYVAACAFGVC